MFGFRRLREAPAVNEGMGRTLRWEVHTMKVAAVLMAAVWAAGMLVWAQQERVSDTKSKIVALEQAWNQAYKSADTKALDSLLDDGIVLVNDDGSVQTEAESLARVKSTPSQAGRRSSKCCRSR